MKTFFEYSQILCKCNIKAKRQHNNRIKDKITMENLKQSEHRKFENQEYIHFKA